MRIWAKTIKRQKIQSEVVREFSLARPSVLEEWIPILHVLCQALDLSRPIFLNKHFNELEQFNRTVFRASDFLEPIAFDLFEIEILRENKEHEFPFHDAY